MISNLSNIVKNNNKVADLLSVRLPKIFTKKQTQSGSTTYGVELHVATWAAQRMFYALCKKGTVGVLVKRCDQNYCKDLHHRQERASS